MRARLDNMSDSDETSLRLKAAVHRTVDRLCQKIAEEQGKEFSRQVVAAITETVVRQCDAFAKDLEAFARHGKRTTVNAEDVKLVARRSVALARHIESFIEELNQEQKESKRKNSGKRKNRDTEEENAE